MRRHLSLVLFALLLVGASGQGDAAQKDLEKMQGEWTVALMVRDGQRIPEDDAQALFRSVKGNSYTVSRFRKVVSKGSFQLDASKSPKHIDATPAMPPGAKPLLAIYQWDRDKLKICFALPGQPRPTDFSAKEGSQHTLTIWEHEK